MVAMMVARPGPSVGMSFGPTGKVFKVLITVSTTCDVRKAIGRKIRGFSSMNIPYRISSISRTGKKTFKGPSLWLKC